jgi:WD40 repeat protein
MLASASDTDVQLWDVQTRHHITTLEGHSGDVESVAFSPDSSRLASASYTYGDAIRVWDVGPGPLSVIQIGHGDAAKSVAFSPDGLRLASGFWDGTVQLWDGTSGTSVATLNGHSHVVTSVAFSPDGSRLASASYDNTVRLWDSRTNLDVTPSARFNTYSRIAFSPDGSKLASVPASNVKTILLRDGSTGISIATLEGHSDSIRCMIFSADGSRFASACGGGTVRVWDTSEAGRCVATFTGLSRFISSIAISADGSRLAAASDKAVWLWDSRTDACIGILRGHSDTGHVRDILSRWATARFSFVGTDRYGCGMVGQVLTLSLSLAIQAGFGPWCSRQMAYGLLQPRMTRRSSMG